MLQQNEIAKQTRAVVEGFMDAWISGDLNRVLSTLADDAVFGGTTGPEPGRTYVGLANIQKVIAAILGPGSTIQLEKGDFCVDGDTAVVTWTTFDRASQSDVASMKGVDVFKVRNGKIVLKDAYRKAY